MKGRISRVLPSPSTAMAAVALFVALGGTSYAVANGVPQNSVGTLQLRNAAVTTPKLAPNAVTTGKIAPNAVTAAKINSSGLTVPNAINANNATNAATAANANHATAADTLTTLASGQTESGTFSAGGGSSTGGYFGFGITFARPLAAPIADVFSASNRIIDTSAHPDAAHCPGAGRAAPGYLCLYFHNHVGVGTVYGYDGKGSIPRRRWASACTPPSARPAHTSMAFGP